MLTARSELEKLSYKKDDRNYRALRINTAVTLGDWSSLFAFLDDELAEKDTRSPEELLEAAQLALYCGSPKAKELLFLAAQKAGDNPSILATAYTLASNAGWDDDAEVHDWLSRAAELSGDGGPIQKMSLKDILEQKPHWDQHESDVWGQLGSGQIPMFLAARALNRSLVSLMLFPALCNLSQNDPRRRGIIPAYSGGRTAQQFQDIGIVGVDATALLTLNFLDLLDTALEGFKTIIIPHSTLAWLFAERQRAMFHQPSRIREAHRLRDLLATNALERMEATSVPDSRLADDIGEEIASLIAEAEKREPEDSRQRIVVRPCPVHRIGSLMEEEADLTGHAAVLSSCQAIVDALRQKGELTSEKASACKAYLNLHEKPWPDQPAIEEGAVLYLDGLAVSYFSHLSILERLQSAGFEAIISQRQIDEANSLIGYATVSEKVTDAIERIRSTLYSGLLSGKVRFAKASQESQSGDESVSQEPTFGVISLIPHVDTIIVDDRFINKFSNITNDTDSAQVCTTLDLLNKLCSEGAVSLETLFEKLTLLRRAGYAFIPLGEDELDTYFEDAAVKQNALNETAELKAIRESIVRVRMSTWLQIPDEATWLELTLKNLLFALKASWREEREVALSQARSEWILDQIDLRGWAHLFGPEESEDVVKTRWGVFLMMLLHPPGETSSERVEQYWNWVEERIVKPIKDQYPDLYTSMVDWHRGHIAQIADTDLTEDGDNGE